MIRIVVREIIMITITGIKDLGFRSDKQRRSAKMKKHGQDLLAQKGWEEFNRRKNKRMSVLSIVGAVTGFLLAVTVVGIYIGVRFNG